MTWTHVSRALVTQEPSPINQTFARKLLEVLTAANNLAVRYLANKALKKDEAQDEEAAIEEVMAPPRLLRGHFVKIFKAQSGFKEG